MNLTSRLIVFFFVLFLVACEQEQAPQIYNVAKKSIVQPSLTSSTKHLESAYTWELPQGWQEIPNTNTMRLASFRMGTAEVTIVSLAGPAGGIVANINRWRGQIGLESLSGQSIMAQIKEVKAGTKLGPLKWILIANPKTPAQAILSGVFQTPETTLFIKATGPLDILQQKQTQFLDFCSSLRQK